MTSPLFERLRSALADQYDVELALGKGGQAAVFLARHHRLERHVAIKVLRPELATAQASERFLREARILAKLRHPHVIPILHADETTDGLSYYVMDYLEEDTLATRLATGPLPLAEARRVALDLLDALDFVHRKRIVHRDVKPSNIFIVNGRTMLADFGIAKEPQSGDESLTATGVVGPGTMKYMAPELLARAEASPVTDLYSAGMVMYEAVTGRDWPSPCDPADANWSGVPPHVEQVLRRALALEPAERWQDAASFRAALEPAERWRDAPSSGLALEPPVAGWRYGRIAAAAAAAVGVVLWMIWPHPEPQATVQVRVARPFVYSRGPDSLRWLSDSISSRVIADLSPPDIRVVERRIPVIPVWGKVRDLLQRTRVGLSLTGRVEVVADTVRLALGNWDSGEPLFPASVGMAGDWVALSDSAANRILDRLYAPDVPGPIPTSALPPLPAARAQALRGEQLLARGWWMEAYRAYERAEALDSSCVLCAWRMTNIERWLGQRHDSARTRRYLDGIARFPGRYRDVIRASRQGSAVRLDSLESVAQRWRTFLDAWFIHGDEAFHRGPLVGRRRVTARASFERAISIRTDFAPALEHLAWLLVAEGDSAGAADALDRLGRLPTPRDPFSLTYRAMLRLARAWRFLPPTTADSITTGILRDPAIAAFPDLGGGARLLLSFDAPLGAVRMGRRFVVDFSRGDVALAGHVAQLTGHLALGHPDSARRYARRLRDEAGDRETDVFAAELGGALFVADSEAVLTWRDDARRLRQLAEFPDLTPLHRNRAAWMLALVERQARDERAANEASRLIAGEPGPGPLGRFVTADSLAAARQWSRALDHSKPLLSLDSGALGQDPLFRALLHLKRAEWWAQQGDTAPGAVEELRWHENTDVEGGIPRGPVPLAAEIDWAFGTLARWRRAELLDQAGERGGEVCAAYRAVVRHWAEGDAPYAGRAEVALRRLATLDCPERP